MPIPARTACRDRVGQVGKEIVTAKENQREEEKLAGDGADSAGDGMAPTTDQAAADGQHVDGTHGRRRCQPDEECRGKYVDVRDDHHVAGDRLG